MELSRVAEKDKENILEFIDSIPTLSLRVDLLINIFRDKTRKVDINDCHDFAYLYPSIVYCDVVFTESTWCHHIKSAGLDKKYNTRVFSDLREIKNV